MSVPSQQLDPLTVAEQWASLGRPVALATVIATWGSAPRPVGSHVVIDADGNFHGSVSGGCVEGDVIAEALAVIDSGQPKLLDFGVADETAWRVGLSCGGRIQIYVELMRREILTRLNSLRHDRHAAVVVTDLSLGTQRLVVEGDSIDDDLAGVVATALHSGKSTHLDVDGASVFVNVYLPPVRIVVIGAVHISQALAPMARLAGFDVTIIDPRSAFSTPERFGDTRLIIDWPQDSLQADPYTALVALAHDPRIDDFAIAAGLQAGCFYVGALGSRKSHAARLGRLLAEGLNEAQLARICAPIGLDIGASNPAEIAVAILAEIIQSLRRRTRSAAAGTP